MYSDAKALYFGTHPWWESSNTHQLWNDIEQYTSHYLWGGKPHSLMEMGPLWVKIDSIIKATSTSICMTSTSSYVRESKKYYELRK